MRMCYTRHFAFMRFESIAVQFGLELFFVRPIVFIFSSILRSVAPDMGLSDIEDVCNVASKYYLFYKKSHDMPGLSTCEIY